ncbi:MULTISPECIES: hypothetical protein [unclassified Endozoicomonas]|uniref:hypothetical protein n=1 Tax=unclassified Endozoicomonas TaxID=2644528 RepID=UPI003BB6313A
MSLESRVTVLEEQQDKWEKVTASLSDSLSFMLRSYQQLEIHLKIHDRKFDKIDQRFKEVDQRFKKVDQRFDKIENYLEDHDRRFDKIEDMLIQIFNKLA